MKRKSLLFLLLFALLAPWAANAQSLFTEDFEDGSMPTGWTTEGSGTWSVATGDYSSSTGAGHGTYNAKITHLTTGSATKLITPEIDLSSVTSAELSFMHVQRSWAGDIDGLKVYYRTSSDGTWTQLMEYTAAYASWTTETIALPNTNGTYQIAFEYIDHYGYGLGIDYVNILPPPSCPAPVLGAAQYITNEGVSFQWTESGSATNWVLQYSTASDFSNPTEIERSGIPSLAITGLSSGTTYYFRMKSVCGADDESDWSNTVSFRTLCDAESIPYTYGFEEADPFGCWTVISGNVSRISGTPNSGDYRLDFRGTTSNMVALPQFSQATNTLRVEFWTRPESTGGSSGKFAVGYMTDLGDASSFVAVATYNSTEMTADYVKKTVDFNNAPSGAIIAMRQFDCQTYYYWYVDDVTVKEIPSCVAPTNLAADATTNSAELSWTANSGETDWTLYWKKSTDETYTEVANATNPYTLNGLDAASTYQYYVVANCSADEASEASEVFSFITECDVITVYPYTENFDSYATGVLPVCWSRINKSTNASYNGYPKISSSYAQSSPNSLYFSSYYTESSSTVDPQDQYAILPEMQNLSSMRIKLYARASSTSAYYDATFHVGVMTDPEDETTFTEVATYKPTTTSYTLYTIPFDTYTGNGTYIAIKMDAAAAIEDYTYAYHVVVFDDITVEEIPSCVEPTNLDVTANGQAATLTWVSEVGAYEIAHALEAAADPDENIAGTATEATYTMNGLALGDHYFWVRANCGNSNSVWVGPVSVHIGYCLPAPTSVDNNGISNVTFGIGDGVVNNNTSMGSSVATYLDYTSMTGSLQAGVESTVAITYKTSYTYGTIIWVDFDNSLSFEESEIIYTGTSTNANPTTLNATFVIPATVTPGNYVMRIGGADSNFDGYIAGTSTTAPNPCYTGTYACFQDYTLRVLEAPACMPVSGLTASNATAHTVDLAWTAGGDETAWVVAYKTAEEEEFTEVPASTNPFTLSGLRAETTYSVKVAADCGDTQSTYTNEITITTDVACPAPTALNVTNLAPTSATLNWTGDATTYNVRYKVSTTGDADPIFSDDFENGLDLASWTIVDADGDGYNWYEHINSGTGNHTTHSGDGVVSSESYNNDASLALTPDNWLITPQVQLGGSVSFWAIGQDASYAEEHFAVFVSTTGTTPADFTQVSQEFVATGEYVNYVADLSSYSGMGYVAIRHFNVTDMFVLNIDDFAVYGPSSTVEEWITINNVSGNSTDLTGLNPETDYIWQVQAVCGGEDGVSAWASSNFTTLSACAAPNNLSAEATATGATLNWTGYQESYNIQYRTAGFDGYYVNETWDGDEIGDWSVSNLQSGGGIFSEAGVDGSKCFGFYYTTNPPQYLISPDLREGVGGKTLTFSYKAYSANYAESFKVGFANGEETSFDEMTWEAEVTTEDTEWHEYQTTVPEGTLYFVIQCTSYDAFYLFVDNFVIYDETEIVEAGAWVDATANENTLAITGLTPETEYEWQVQGVCENGETDWVNAYFTTLEQTTITQTIVLTSGVNWVSVGVEVTRDEFLSALVAGSGANNITVKSQTSTSKWNGRMWRPELSGWDVMGMYLVTVPEACEMTLEGMAIDPATHPVAIGSGSTYIGFPLSASMTLDEAFSGFAVVGDRIANQNVTASYARTGWRNAFNLEPGKGYIYKSASAAGERTLVFPTPTGSKSVQGEEPAAVSVDAKKVRKPVTTVDLSRKSGVEMLRKSGGKSVFRKEIK